MIKHIKQLGKAAALGLVLTMSAGAGVAQGLFSPAVIVNESVITNYEIDQRVRMLTLFRTPGDLATLAREQLIEDRLKLALMQADGLNISDEALRTAMENFAARADLSLEDFLRLLEQNGVAEETLRDFVLIGQTWRDYIRARYARQAQPSEAEIDAALGEAGSGTTSIEVLLSEIIIAAPPPQAAAAQAEAQRISQITSFSAFESAARQVSALPSRDRGGRLDWLPIDNYPPQLRALLLSLAPGEVTPPINITNGVALFQMRDVREVTTAPAPPASIDYAVFYMGPEASPGEIAARVDSCDDLYGVAYGLPEERLLREDVAPAEIETDIAMELAKLDANEYSTALTRNDGTTGLFVMLCSRTPGGEDAPDRDSIAEQLTSQRLSGFADALLADLRASATIVTP